MGMDGRRRDGRRGFTLIELMIVLVILAILVLVALPAYRSAVARSHRADAQATLLAFAQAMERRYQHNYTYGGAAADAADTGAPAAAIFPDQSPLEGRPAYDLTIERVTLDPPYYRLRATPIAGGAQDGDGMLQYDALGQRGWDADNSGTIDASERAWER